MPVQHVVRQFGLRLGRDRRPGLRGAAALSGAHLLNCPDLGRRRPGQPGEASASMARPRSARAAELARSITAPPFSSMPSTTQPSSSVTFQMTASSPSMVGRLAAGGPIQFQQVGFPDGGRRGREPGLGIAHRGTGGEREARGVEDDLVAVAVEDLRRRVVQRRRQHVQDQRC